MPHISNARTIDISHLVRLRTHLSWSSQAMGALGCLAVVAPFEWPDLRDPVYVGADGVLALVTLLVLVRGWVTALPPLSISLVALNTFLTTRFVAASMPIDTDNERSQLACGVVAVAASLYVLGICLAPFFRAARRSPYLKVVFATHRTLGVDYAGGALSWKGWFRQLRPWAVVIGALTFVVSITAMMIVRRIVGKNKDFEQTIRDSVFAAGGALFVWTKRKSALSGTAVRQIDRRPPVLLLRSFDDDTMIIRRGARRSRSTDLHRKGMTFERVVQDHLAPFGPFIAIGRPEEPLSPLGAARDYVPDTTWQNEVQQRIHDAAVVVLVIGTSQGLVWELSRLRDLGQLHKLILVFPPADDVVDRWHTLLGRTRAVETSILPDEVRPEQTLALIYADDLTPIIIEGKRDERSYETALRLGGMLAITAGTEPDGAGVTRRVILQPLCPTGSSAARAPVGQTQ
jgi:hypothetical protein